MKHWDTLRAWLAKDIIASVEQDASSQVAKHKASSNTTAKKLKKAVQENQNLADTLLDLRFEVLRLRRDLSERDTMLKEQDEKLKVLEFAVWTAKRGRELSEARLESLHRTLERATPQERHDIQPEPLCERFVD